MLLEKQQMDEDKLRGLALMVLRRQRDLEQKEAATLAGIDQSMLSKYEKGKGTTHMRQSTLLKLLAVYGRTPLEFEKVVSDMAG